MHGHAQARLAGIEPATYGLGSCRPVQETPGKQGFEGLPSQGLPMPAEFPPDLQRVVEAWPALPEEVRQQVLNLVDGSIGEEPE